MRLYTAILVTAPIQEANTNIGLQLVRVNLTRYEVLRALAVVLKSVPEVEIYADFYNASKYPLDFTYENMRPDKSAFFQPKKIEPVRDPDIIAIYGDENVFPTVRDITITYQLDIDDLSILQRSNDGRLFVRCDRFDKIKLELANVANVIAFVTDEYAKQEHIDKIVELISHKGLQVVRSRCVLV